jgi:hypothetical protein
MGRRLSSGCIATLSLGFVLLLHVNILQNGAGTVSAAGYTCQQVLIRAMNLLQAKCDGVGRNVACYGHTQVKAQPRGDLALRFEAEGDRVAVQDIQSLVTFPLDEQTGTWGLSLLKLQANVPDSVPGQNITFLVVGETSIDNASGDMQSFYFSTGLGSVTCKEAPRDALVVRSPKHNEVTFTANGVEVTIGSTVVLRAERNRAMTIELIEGHARITAMGGTRVLKPGEMLSIPLGGANGLTAVGVPSVPAPVMGARVPATVLALANRLSDPDAPANISISGCVTAVNGNVVEISGYKLDARQNGTLKGAKVGDCLRIGGRLALDRNNQVVWVLGTVRQVANVTSSATGNRSGGLAPDAAPTITALPLPDLPTLPPVPTLGVPKLP